MPAEPVDELQQRIDAFVAHYIEPFLRQSDAGPALSPRALEDGDRLWEFSQSCTPDGLVSPAVVHALSMVRQIRHEASGRAPGDRDADAGLALLSLAMRWTPPGHVPPGSEALATDPDYWVLQAGYILSHAAVCGLPMIDEAVRLYRGALERGADRYQERGMSLANLGLALMTRCERTRRRTDLDEALHAFREALALLADETPHRTEVCLLWENAAFTRFRDTDDPANLDECIEAARQCLRGPDSAIAERSERFASLGRYLGIRFGLAGDPADITAAIDAYRDALSMVADDDPARPFHLSALAGHLRSRFTTRGDEADLDAAARYGSQAVQLIRSRHPDHPERAMVFTALCALLTVRHRHRGGEDDVEAAVGLGRAALKADPEAAHRARCMRDMAAALHRRYVEFHDQGSLDEALAIIREALTLPSTERDEPASRWEVLAEVLYDQSAGHADPDIAQEAIQAARQAVDATPSGHIDLPDRLHLLAMSLRHGHLLSGRAEDLTEAIQAELRAVATAPPTHAHRGLFLTLLGAALHERFLAGSAQDDLDGAIAFGRSAMDTTPSGDAHQAVCADHLARALRTRHRLSGDARDADEAIGLWREVASTGSAPTRQRMEAARSWGDLAAHTGTRWEDAAEGYAMAVLYLPLLAWRGLDRAGRERLLSQWGGTAQDAAACAVASGRPEDAVAMLELGRDVLWGQVLEHRGDLAELRAAAPDLAVRLDEVRAELDERRAAPTDRRMALARQFETLLAETWSIPGMQDFLRFPHLHDLYPGSGESVVIVNVSRWRCDALIVAADGVTVVPLPRLTHDEVRARALRFLGAVRSVRPSSGYAADPGRMEAVIAREETMADTLAWLWDTVAEPVLTALGHRSTPASEEAWPHLWWCPTGLLSMLPLHAAGHHDDRPPRSRTVLDRVVSSFTSTLRARSRSHGGQAPEQEGLLVVSVPEPPGRPPLRNVAAETELLGALVPVERRLVLSGAEATRPNVLERLATRPLVHFSCHGRQDLADPSRGGLLLHDKVLSVADLAAGDYGGGRFAFLSACETAVGGVENADESITLAAALHYAGYRHVIGTLWPVPDGAAKAASESVYGRLIERGRPLADRSAAVLHQTVRAMRDAAPHTPSSWAAFLHVGG